VFYLLSLKGFISISYFLLLQHSNVNKFVSGITRAGYLEAIGDGGFLRWRCNNCPGETSLHLPQAESTRLSAAAYDVRTEESVDESQDEEEMETGDGPEEMDDVQDEHQDDEMDERDEMDDDSDDVPPQRQPLDFTGIDDLPSYSIPEPTQEPSLLNVVPRPAADSDSDDDVVFELLESGSQRAKPKLASSDGYHYTIAKVRESATYWRCSIRSTKKSADRSRKSCSATVTQRGNSFTIGKHSHNHPSQPGISNVLKIRQDVKSRADRSFFTPASDMVDAVLMNRESAAPAAGMVKTINLTRLSRWKDDNKFLCNQAVSCVATLTCIFLVHDCFCITSCR